MGVIMKNKVNYTGGGGSGGASALADLEDVELTTPTDGQALVYDAENDLWVNGGVVGSGGGSAKYSETVLWEGNARPNSSTTYTLSDSIENYNVLVILGVGYTNGTAVTMLMPMFIPVSTIVYGSDTTEGYTTNASIGNIIRRPTMCFTDATHFKVIYVDSGENTNTGYIKVIGIKWETMQTALIYSQEEREVGVWIDGKPLYQKTINFGALPLTATKTVAHNIADVDKIWVYDGFVYGTSGIYYQLNRTTNSFTYQWETRVDSTNVVMQDFAAFGNDHSAIITLQYTKTTDTAGSGIWTTTGEYAHHYSTDEKVVGTWTDKKPLYERTVKVAANSSGVVTLWTDSSVAIQEYNGKFIIRNNLATLSLWGRIADSTYKSALMGVGNNTTYGVYADIELGSSRTNKLDLELTIRYTKTTD